MTPSEFRELTTGDIVRHAKGDAAYVVHANYGDHVTAARTVDLTNPLGGYVMAALFFASAVLLLAGGGK